MATFNKPFKIIFRQGNHELLLPIIKKNMKEKSHLLHRTMTTIKIAPNIADNTETIIRVSGHPNSDAFSEKNEREEIKFIIQSSKAKSKRKSKLTYCSFKNEGTFSWHCPRT